jgi:F-type H+-transporting ATPase subunit epsilon
MPLNLRIITPERVVFEVDGVESVTLPGSEGELTVLPSHAPLMTELRPGALTFRQSGGEIDVALSGGFLEVRDDNVIVLADTAERSEEIDAARAEQARQQARERLATPGGEGTIDVAAALAALQRAEARIKVAERYRRRRGTGAPPVQPPGT